MPGRLGDHFLPEFCTTTREEHIFKSAVVAMLSLLAREGVINNPDTFMYHDARAEQLFFVAAQYFDMLSKEVS